VCQEGTKILLRKQRVESLEGRAISQLGRDSEKLHVERKCVPGPRLNFIAEAQEGKHHRDPIHQGSQEVVQR
jgi:hypothetical protein